MGRGSKGSALTKLSSSGLEEKRFFCANLNTSEKERGEGGERGRKKHLKSGRLPSFLPHYAVGGRM